MALQQRGFSGTVRAEQHHDFAGRDVQVHLVQHDDLAVARAEATDVEQMLRRQGMH
jgi:hypothetical protein